MAFKEQKQRTTASTENGLSLSISGSIAHEFEFEDENDDGDERLWRRLLRSFMCIKKDVKVRPTTLQNVKFRLAELTYNSSLCEATVREQLNMHSVSRLDSVALRASRIGEFHGIAEDDEDDDVFVQRQSSDVKKKNLERRASKKMKDQREAIVEVLKQEQNMVESGADEIKGTVNYRAVFRGNVHVVARDAVDNGMKDLMGMF